MKMAPKALPATQAKLWREKNFFQINALPASTSGQRMKICPWTDKDQKCCSGEAAAVLKA